MKLERTKNATKNIIYGTILKIYQIVIPFLMRTAMIYILGVEYLGLNSLFTSVLQVLNLVELGVGAAMVFSMYEPIANDEHTKICALMNLYKIYYRIIGIVILSIGIIITPFIPRLINGTVPSDMNVYILYIMNLMATVLSYWLFAYKNCLLQAHQRKDITSKITLIINTIMYILQFLLLFIFKNYYWYVILLLFGQIAINITTAIVVDRLYPKYRAKGHLPKSEIKEINGRVRDLFTSKIGGVIVNSADSIVISSFLGLTMLAIYQNYFYIVSAIIAIGAVIFGSCTAGIGNSIITETSEKNYNDLKKFTFIIFWLAGFCASAILCLTQNFMQLWVGKSLLLGFSAVIFFTIYYFVQEINALLLLYKDASGIWHSDRFRPLITALTNLILNLILVNFWGIYGVLLSTVIATFFIGFPWLVHNLFKEVFKRSPREYLVRITKYAIIVLFVIVITYSATTLVKGNTFISLCLRAIICVVISNGLFYILFRGFKEMDDAKKLAKKMLRIKK